MHGVVAFKSITGIVDVPYTITDEGILIQLPSKVKLLLSPVHEKFVFKEHNLINQSKISENGLSNDDET